jgi:hypothetical protein
MGRKRTMNSSMVGRSNLRALRELDDLSDGAVEVREQGFNASTVDGDLPSSPIFSVDHFSGDTHEDQRMRERGRRRRPR